MIKIFGSDEPIEFIVNLELQIFTVTYIDFDPIKSKAKERRAKRRMNGAKYVQSLSNEDMTWMTKL
jgi:hypothetical protein